VLADGTDGTRANKVYTALSRHRDASYLLVSDAAIRRQLAKRSIIGEAFDVRQPDVWRQVGTNISRVQVRENATSSLRRVNRPGGPTGQAGQRPQHLRDLTVRRVMAIARQIPGHAHRHAINAVQHANDLWRANRRDQPENRLTPPSPSRGIER
jgi:hypothetical protein